MLSKTAPFLLCWYIQNSRHVHNTYTYTPVTRLYMILVVLFIDPLRKPYNIYMYITALGVVTPSTVSVYIQYKTTTNVRHNSDALEFSLAFFFFFFFWCNGDKYTSVIHPRLYLSACPFFFFTLFYFILLMPFYQCSRKTKELRMIFLFFF